MHHHGSTEHGPTEHGHAEHGHAEHRPAEGAHHHGSPTGDPQRIAAVWPWVRTQLAPTTGPVLEVGCGPIGGFVPALLAAGRSAVGVDPLAPGGPEYRQATVEEVAPDGSFGAVIACASLHHVRDLPALADHLAGVLRPGGRAVVVEWAWERIDAATVQWCFDRLPDGAQDSWLSRQRAAWQESGLVWDEYVRRWAAAEDLQPGAQVARALGNRFRTLSEEDVPYFHPYLTVDEDAERAAAAAGLIQLAGIRWVGELVAETH